MGRKVLYDDNVRVSDLTVGELKDIIIESLVQMDKIKARESKQFLIEEAKII